MAVVPRPQGFSRQFWLLIGGAALVLAGLAWWGLSTQQRARAPAAPLPPLVSGGESARSASAPIQTSPDSAREATTVQSIAAPETPATIPNLAASAPKSARAAAADDQRAAAPPAPPAAAASPPASVQVADGKSAAPVAKPTGRVAFAVTPWGEVHVDGRLRGVSPPLQEIRVAPGKHVVEFRNSTFPPFRETVDVPADGAVRVKHKFQ